MMNRKHLKSLISRIETSRDFTMTRLDKCVCGHAWRLLNRKMHAPTNKPREYYEKALENWLEISRDEALEISMPLVTDVAYVYSVPGEEDFVTRSMALKVLRHLLRTGRVEWRILE